MQRLSKEMNNFFDNRTCNIWHKKSGTAFDKCYNKITAREEL